MSQKTIISNAWIFTFQDILKYQEKCSVNTVQTRLKKQLKEKLPGNKLRFKKGAIEPILTLIDQLGPYRTPQMADALVGTFKKLMPEPCGKKVFVHVYKWPVSETSWYKEYPSIINASNESGIGASTISAHLARKENGFTDTGSILNKSLSINFSIADPRLDPEFAMCKWKRWPASEVSKTKIAWQARWR